MTYLVPVASLLAALLLLTGFGPAAVGARGPVRGGASAHRTPTVYAVPAPVFGQPVVPTPAWSWAYSGYPYVAPPPIDLRGPRSAPASLPGAYQPAGQTSWSGSPLNTRRVVTCSVPLPGYVHGPGAVIVPTPANMPPDAVCLEHWGY
jgi:hypothetical protein